MRRAGIEGIGCTADSARQTPPAMLRIATSPRAGRQDASSWRHVAGAFSALPSISRIESGTRTVLCVF